MADFEGLVEHYKVYGTGNDRLVGTRWTFFVNENDCFTENRDVAHVVFRAIDGHLPVSITLVESRTSIVEKRIASVEIACSRNTGNL